MSSKFAPSLLTGITLVGSLFISSVADAQMMPTVARQAKLYNTVSVHLNAMNYFGDVVPKTSFTSFRFLSTRPNIGISAAHRFSPRISGRGGLSVGQISGSDNKSADKDDSEASYRYNRNLSFRNNIVELSAVGMIDLFENRGTYLKRREFAPYLFAGVAAFYHSPMAKDAKGDFVALQPLGTEGQFAQNRAARGYAKPYKRTQISIPFGFGVNYKLDRQLSIGYEMGWRKTFTDYLDDASGTYADPNDLKPEARYLADPSNQDFKLPTNSTYPKFTGYGVRGQKRGTNNENDWYIVSGFHLSYIIVSDTKSPKFR
jgi:hypothetical protein